MNARQAAKYYKRKYREFAEMPVPVCKMMPSEVVTLQNQRMLPHPEFVGQVTKSMCSELADKLIEYGLVKVSTEEGPFHEISVTVRINVLKPTER